MRKVTLNRVDAPVVTDGRTGYSMELTVTSADNMPKEVFVKQRLGADTASEVFATVATVAQLEELFLEPGPTSYFRSSVVSFVTSNQSSLDELYNQICVEIATLIENLNALDKYGELRTTDIVGCSSCTGGGQVQLIPGPVGPQGPQGIQGAQGIPGTFGVYGSFYDTTTQPNTNAPDSNTMAFNSTLCKDRVSIVNGTRITPSVGGIYNIQFSAQFDKTDSGSDDVNVWIAVNGVDVPWTNTELTLVGNNAKAVAAWNFVIPINAGQYAELKWASIDTDLRIYAQPAIVGPPSQPGIPSTIVTIQQISTTNQV